jgi:glutamate 5-kinase
LTAVEGEFGAGDPVDLSDPQGRVVARGLVAYDASELPGMLGRSTAEMGPGYSREVVHRDDLVLMPDGLRLRRAADKDSGGPDTGPGSG